LKTVNGAYERIRIKNGTETAQDPGIIESLFEKADFGIINIV
jgi:hypothetical protein